MSNKKAIGLGGLAIGLIAGGLWVYSQARIWFPAFDVSQGMVQFAGIIPIMAGVILLGVMTSVFYDNYKNYR